MGEQNTEIDVMLVGKEHAADRLMRSQKLWRGGPYLGDEEPPTRRQVAAVLHALADHALIENMLHRAPELGAHRAHLGNSWAAATGLGRYFQHMGNWLEGPASATTPDDPCFCRAVPNIGGGGCNKPGCPRAHEPRYRPASDGPS